MQLLFFSHFEFTDMESQLQKICITKSYYNYFLETLFTHSFSTMVDFTVKECIIKYEVTKKKKIVNQ